MKSGVKLKTLNRIKLNDHTIPRAKTEHKAEQSRA
jgi:hypothetical protein